MSDTDKDIEILTLRHQLASGRPASHASPRQTALSSPLCCTGFRAPGCGNRI